MRVFNVLELSPIYFGVLGLLVLGLTSCDVESETAKNEWPQEFYLAKKACYTRYFYENVMNSNQEYELYCNDHSVLSLTKTADSVCYDDEMETQCLTVSAFEERFGTPEELRRVSKSKLTFSLDTLNNWNTELDASTTSRTQNEGLRVALSVNLGDKKLFSKNYNCSRIKSFDPALILVYQAESNDSIYFIDGEPNCLILEMEYYDEDGEFGGWDQFSSDIKALRVVN